MRDREIACAQKIGTCLTFAHRVCDHARKPLCCRFGLLASRLLQALRMRLRLAAIAALAGLLVSQTNPSSALAASSAASRCPGYESLMKAAAQSLRAGDRAAALKKLREARSALDACTSQAQAGSRLG